MHNHLAKEAELVFKRSGFEVTPECGIALENGRIDFVDLLAQRDDCWIACEVETTSRNVLSNVIKAKPLDMPLWILVPNGKVRSAVQRRLRQAGQGADGDKVQIFLLGQLSKAISDCFSRRIATGKTGKTNR